MRTTGFVLFLAMVSVTGCSTPLAPSGSGASPAGTASATPAARSPVARAAPPLSARAAAAPALLPSMKDAPALHLSFENETPVDVSPNALRVQAVGRIALTDGPCGPAVRLGGTKCPGHLLIQPCAALTVKEDLTIAAWVRVTGTAGQGGQGEPTDPAPQAVFARGNDRTGFLAAFFPHPDGTLTFSVGKWGGAVYADGARVNQWAHVAFTRGAHGTRLFINGACAGSDASPADPAEISGQPFSIGAMTGIDPFTYHATADLCDVRVYARALTSEEVAGLVACRH